MGQIFSRYFGRRDEGVSEEEDNTNLIEAQADTARQEDKENCFQYLKRKFTSVFTQQSSQCKKTRLDEEIYQNVEPVPIQSEVVVGEVEEDIQIDNTEVEINTEEEQGNERIINTEIKESLTNETSTHPYLDHPFLTDQSSIESMKNSLTMIIMRGMPGSGKSTIVRRLKELYPEVNFLSFLFIFK